MMKVSKLVSGIVILLCIGCFLYFTSNNSKKYNNNFDRNYIKTVTEYYSENESDSLKLKAFFFLVENMKEFKVLNTLESKLYKTFFNELQELKDSINHLDVNDRDIIMKNSFDTRLLNIWNSSKQKNGFDINYHELIPDTQVVDSKFLINNIDLAFDVWKLPWAKELTFDEFCEYILPYRGFGEPIENWRQTYLENNIWLLDSMQSSSNRIKACNILNKNLESWFKSNLFFVKHYRGSQGPLQLLKSQMGKCIDQVNLTIYSMRSLGLPVTMDYTLLYGDFSTGHSWNSLLLENGNSLNFQGADGDLSEHEFPHKLSKVFRKTFSENRNCIANKTNINNIPPNLRDKHYIDVTKEYSHIFKSESIEIKIKDSINQEEKYAYLCTFDNSKWRAIDWAEVKNNKVVFKDVGVDIVYLIGFYNRKKGIVPSNIAPFLLMEGGEIEYFSPKKAEEEIVINRKFPLSKSMQRRANTLKKGVFQGSNKLDFSDAEDIFIINEKDSIYPYFTIKETFNKKKYRYVRFVLDKNTQLAELAFYSTSGTKNDFNPLKGIPISFKKINSSFLSKLFDGKTENYLSYPIKQNTWYGLDLLKSKTITHVGFCPRNDSNNVEPNNIYELLYWNNGWKSLGVKKANSNEIKYKKVPENSLLWIRNVTKGVEERIFSFENNQQVWW